MNDSGSSHSRRNPLRRVFGGRPTAVIGAVVLAVTVLACVLAGPFVFGTGASGQSRHAEALPAAGLLQPAWWPADEAQLEKTRALSAAGAAPRYFLGTDQLGRSLLLRLLAGGAISLAVGISAALLSVFIGTIYGGLAGYLGGRTDAVLMRGVDVLYGIPTILLVVLLAVASDAAVDNSLNRNGERRDWVETHAAAVLADRGEPAGRVDARRLLEHDPALRASLNAEASEKYPVLDSSTLLFGAGRTGVDLLVLLVSIGGVSWLTTARVVRGQVLSLREQPFIESARALGVPTTRILWRHLLPNLVGTIVVYTSLSVPQAILQESFLSFLGIGVKPPLPSWGTLAAEGLTELNPYKSHWWLLLFPCLMLSLTLLSLNWIGEALRERLDPRSAPWRAGGAA